MDNFDFRIGKLDIPMITLTANGLSFNQHCIAALDYPEYVHIGLDRQSKKLAVKARTDDQSFHSYHFVTDENKKKRVLVTAYPIRDAIERLVSIPIQRRGVQFFVEYDAASGTLIADLTTYMPIK